MNYSISDLTNGAKTIAKSVFGKKKEYTIKFNHEEDGLWYVDFPNWPFDHGNLLMVGGATYQVKDLPGFERNIWLCPVTLFVLGQYPKYMYIKKAN